MREVAAGQRGAVGALAGGLVEPAKIGLARRFGAFADAFGDRCDFARDGHGHLLSRSPVDMDRLSGMPEDRADRPIGPGLERGLQRGFLFRALDVHGDVAGGD